MSDPAPRAGNTKVTRDDWLAVAKDMLVNEGVEQVKILTLAERLEVSRSSFYWYFRDREHLLDDLLTEWSETNTGVFQRHCALPSTTLTEAILNLFLCFVGPDGFNHRLDFAVREWARRSDEVARVVAEADAQRILAIARLYKRFGHGPKRADIRARILYYMQIGYYALDLDETLEERLTRVPDWVEGFTGLMPSEAELVAFTKTLRATQGG